ncbi:MAG: arylesterase [Butyrivibrio sp.]|nr:arylesterase [Butyrivibrio sp.]
MKNILAFGDSNTWGLIPGTSPYERYPWGVRWTSILQEKFDDVRIIEEGLCGRTTVFEDELRPGRKGVDTLPLLLESHYPLDGAIIMLGTNDCKSYYNVSAHTIGIGLERCLDALSKYVAPENILIISPIELGSDVWRPEKDPEFSKQSIITSQELKNVYRRIAQKRGTGFLAASDYVKASTIDDEHMDANSHKLFAEVVYKALFDQLYKVSEAKRA